MQDIDGSGPDSSAAEPPDGASNAPHTSTEPSLGLLLSGVFLAAIAVMVPALSGPFLYDDTALISGNRYIQDLSYWPRWFFGSVWDTGEAAALAPESLQFWRPLILASFALDWQWGGGPFGFHVTNVLCHAFNTLSLSVLLTGWLGKRVPALAAALLFAVHPVQTESIAWISGRTDAFCLAGMLIATLGLRLTRVRRAAGAVALGLGLTVAALSKEMFVVFPCLFAVELWSWEKKPLDPAPLKALCRKLVLPALLALGYVATYLAIVRRDHAGAPALGQHIASVFEAYGRYFVLLLWPDDLALSRAILVRDLDGVHPHVAFVVVGALAIALIGVLAARFRRRAPLAVLGGLVTLALLAPVSSIIWLGERVLVSPRFLYIPMLGVVIVVGALLTRFSPSRAVAGVTALVLVLAAGRCWGRALDYSEVERFWRVEYESSPQHENVQDHFVARELQAGRPRAALRLSHTWFQEVPAYDPRRRTKLLWKSIQALSRMTPDVDREGLRRIRAFVQALSDGRNADLELPAVGLKMSLGAPKEAPSAATRRAFEMEVANLSSRLGDDTTARELAAKVVADCPECGHLHLEAALIFARSGAHEDAIALVRRARSQVNPEAFELTARRLAEAEAIHQKLQLVPNQGPLRAEYHLALGAFGRAYDVARPAIQAPPSDPGALLSLSRLAVLAGDIPVARQLLQRAGVQVEEELDRLSRLAPWHEQPREPTEWMPL